MSTLTQRFQQHQALKFYKRKRQALANCPHRRGRCMKVFKKPPKKPCSARRAVTYVRLNKGAYILCKIPGERTQERCNIEKFTQVLVRGGRVLDLPSTHYKLVFTKKPGYESVRGLSTRLKGRSKFALTNEGRRKHIRRIMNHPTYKLKKVRNN